MLYALNPDRGDMGIGGGSKHAKLTRLFTEDQEINPLLDHAIDSLLGMPAWRVGLARFLNRMAVYVITH